MGPKARPSELGEVMPREWTVRKPGHNLLWQIHKHAKSLIKTVYPKDDFYLAVHDHFPARLAFYRCNREDDLILIVPTPRRKRRSFFPQEKIDLRTSLNDAFIKRLLISIASQRTIGYQFLTIHKAKNEEIEMELGEVIESDLWINIICPDRYPVKYDGKVLSSIRGKSIYVTHESLMWGMRELHIFDVPLESLTPRLEKIILERSAFSRVIPHGHKTYLGDFLIYKRTVNDAHPVEQQIIDQHRGAEVRLTCNSCGTSVYGFTGETMCALCARELDNI